MNLEIRFQQRALLWVQSLPDVPPELHGVLAARIAAVMRDELQEQLEKARKERRPRDWLRSTVSP
jgi:hypothetical protein